MENEDVVGAAPTGDDPTTSWVINNFIANMGASYIRGLAISVIQSGAFIVWSNITCYYTYHWSDWGRIKINSLNTHNTPHFSPKQWDVFLRFCIKKKSCVIKAPHCTYVLVTEKINAYKNSSNESGMTRQISQQRMTFFNSWFISLNYELRFRFQTPYISWNSQFDMISDKYILNQGTLCIHNIYRNIHP